MTYILSVLKYYWHLPLFAQAHHIALMENGDVRHSLADISKARDCLKYEPGVGIETGLKKTAEFFGRQVSRKPHP